MTINYDEIIKLAPHLATAVKLIKESANIKNENKLKIGIAHAKQDLASIEACLG